MAKQQQATAERTLRDGNGRVARLARWLEQPPASATVDLLVLELRTPEGEWSRLQMWSRDQVSQTLAYSIDETIQDHANEVGTYTTARVAWFDSKRETYWTEQQLRVHPESMGEGMQAFDGTNQSQAIQLQRHQERVLGMGQGMQRESMQCMRETMQFNREIAANAQRENIELRTRVAELEGDLARMTAIADEAVRRAEQAEESSEASDDKKQVFQLIQGAIGAHMMKPKAAP